MTTGSTITTSKIRKQRAFSWTTARRFRFPSSGDRRLGLAKIQRALQGCADAGSRPCLTHDRFLPGSLYAALVWTIEHVALPMDRYHAYLEHGETGNVLTELRLSLSGHGIDADRVERLEEALLALEPYPSKAPVERHQIVRVLADCGGIQPDYERGELERLASADSLPGRRDIPV